MTIICFSATASFASGAVLLAVGSIAVRRAHKPDYAYAAIPLLFGIQQIIEGGLWLVLAERASSQQCLTVGYLGFANILWPIYAPLAIWLMEPGARGETLSIAFAGEGQHHKEHDRRYGVFDRPGGNIHTGLLLIL